MQYTWHITFYTFKVQCDDLIHLYFGGKGTIRLADASISSQSYVCVYVCWEHLRPSLLGTFRNIISRISIPHPFQIMLVNIWEAEILFILILDTFLSFIKNLLGHIRGLRNLCDKFWTAIAYSRWYLHCNSVWPNLECYKGSRTE